MTDLKKYYGRYEKSKSDFLKRKHEEEIEMKRELGIRVSKPKPQNSYREKIWQEMITDIWRATGEFRFPDEKDFEKKCNNYEKLFNS